MATGENTLYVGGAGFGNYTTIQDAINSSQNNDTVYVYNGIYYENLVVNKSINLVGSNRNDVIVNDSSNLYVFLIKSPEVNISGFTIQGGEVGIFALGSEYSFNNFSDNIISDNYEGIRLVNSSNNKIINNVIQYQRNFGIVLYESTYNDISMNSFMMNSKAISLSRWSDNNSIQVNNFAENDYGIYLEFSFGNLLSKNLIANGEYGVYLTSSKNNNVTDNTIEYNRECGIHLSDSDDNVILPNIFLKNYNDNCRDSGPPEVKVPGFEIIVLICAIFFVLLLKKRYYNSTY